MIPDKNDRLAVKNRDQQVKKRGFRHLVDDHDVYSYRSDIYRFNTVPSKFLKLCRCKSVTARTRDPENVRGIVQFPCISRPVFF